MIAQTTPALANSQASVSQRTDTTHQTHHTSAQAKDALGNKGVARRDSEILNIVLSACRNGVADLSGKEIQKRYEFIHGKRIDASTISGCLTRLVSAKRVERTVPRACLETGFNIVPVRAVVQQVRLSA